MSVLEDELAMQIEGAGLPVPSRQCREPWEGTGRRFRGDLCWPGIRLVVEVDGGTWSGGRHTTGSGYARDCEKSNLAQLAGWRVLRFDSKMVRDGRALQTVEAAMPQEGP